MPHFDNAFCAALALRHCPGLGARGAAGLVRAFGSILEAANQFRAWPSRGLTPVPVAEAFRSGAWERGARDEERAALALGAPWLCLGDEAYPELLTRLPDPPLLLYYSGDIRLLSNPAVAVVGARECTNLGLRSAERISTDLSRAGITVVSGLAVGIDRQAHLGGLAGPGGSIAVLGAGLDRDYPSANGDVRLMLEQRGLVLTEYGPGTQPHKGNFPVRNRVIAGLALGVVVAEAASKSGSLITARLALDLGREVYAVPGPLGQPTFVGCHDLIKKGALLVESAEDILENLRVQLRLSLEDAGLRGSEEVRLTPPPPVVPKPARRNNRSGAKSRPPAPPPPRRPAPELPADLEPLERAILALLSREQKQHIDALCQALDKGSGEVGSALLILEMKGLCRQWPGMCYTLFEDGEDYGAPA